MSTKRNPHRTRPAYAKTTKEANAELLLLQSLALRLGQEAARQNNIPVNNTLPLGDPHNAHLATLDTDTDDPLPLTLTITLTVNPKTGAATNLHPHP